MNDVIYVEEQIVQTSLAGGNHRPIFQPFNQTPIKKNSLTLKRGYRKCKYVPHFRVLGLIIKQD